jgi:dolichol-phosphate mannosyltransferase
MSQEVYLSLIVPVHNEEKNLPSFFAALKGELAKIGRPCEVIFINDGSSDNSQAELEKIAANVSDSIGENTKTLVRILEFSRNFGKEIALTAGLNNCVGEAAIMIDADLQHPVELIPEFVAKWERGADVVVGIRQKNKKCGFIKHYGSFLFYKIIGWISSTALIPNATDFRLLDRQVIDQFNKFPEHQRMTRALIAWLGFNCDYIYFEARERENGRPSYSFGKLVSLAMNSFISLSLIPLKWAGYLGLLIIFIAGPFGLYVLIGKYLAHWHFASSFSGPAQLALLITFLVGIVLCSLGLVALYIAHIHNEVLGRPLYVLKKKRKLDL